MPTPQAPADDVAPGTAQDDPEETGGVAGAVASMFDPDRGWTTAKVVVLVVVTSLVVAMLAVTLSERFDGRDADSVEVGFLQDMIHHHEQAVQLGVLGTELATDDDVSHYALEAVIAQQYEIGYMEALLEEWGHGTGDRDRTAMSWMGMPTPIEDMPGMASDEQMAAFRDASGAEANEMFLRLMSEHHRGGVHMAEYAAEHATDERVASLAARMARNQTAELGEYAATADRLGLPI